MAFPVVAAVNSNVGVSSAFSITLNLPASISAGDLLIAIVSSSAPSTFTWPGGWNELYDAQASATLGGSAAAKIADGGEGASITVTSSVTDVDFACHSLRLTGAHASAMPEVGTAASGSSAAPDPPALTPSWGAAETMWFAIAHVDFGTITGAPTSYTDLTTAHSGDTPTSAHARRENNTATENPSAFTSTDEVWIAQTMAVRPAAGGAAPLSVWLEEPIIGGSVF